MHHPARLYAQPLAISSSYSVSVWIYSIRPGPKNQSLLLEQKGWSQYQHTYCFVHIDMQCLVCDLAFAAFLHTAATSSAFFQVPELQLAGILEPAPEPQLLTARVCLV